jgi:glycosyltransferase involved in cell wall biosynthesis
MPILSDLKKSKSCPRVAFFDVNIFAHEGFTSGALIQMKEILRRCLDFGIPAGVLSVAHAPLSPNWKKEKRTGKYETLCCGIPVEEWLIKDSFKKDLKDYRRAIKKLLGGYNWRVIFMNTPAVYLEKVNLVALEEAILTGAEVVSILPDVLYPSYATHPKEDVDQFYRLLKKTRVMAPSHFLIDRFFKDTGIQAELFPNLFTIDEIIARNGSHEFITLVNHHPMKGGVIFDAVAQRMPEEHFLVIENWPDVPPYKPSSPNVKFSNFFDDVRILYGQTKILLVPSLCEEGCPRVIIEALLNGIPVIAHNIGGIPEASLGITKLIDPPPIEGEVILPEVLPDNLDKQADKFVAAIREILTDPQTWTVHLEKSRHVALEYCHQADKKFKSLVKEWFPNKK